MFIAEKYDEVKRHFLYNSIFKILNANEKQKDKYFKEALTITKKHVGDKVYLRGLIEVSNVCQKNCYYCGIRKDNKKVDRYTLTRDEIFKAIDVCHNKGYGSIVIQAGEQTGKKFINLIDDAIKYALDKSGGQIGVTLSLGEQSYETYQMWKNSGALRYLLRIETTNRLLYKKIHPDDHSFKNRLNCLKMLREIGYQVGTGVMIGLPLFHIDDLVNDVLFYKDMDVDMIGMGPYVVHSNTPLARLVMHYDNDYYLDLSLKMIAATRIICKDVNIASTTALDAIHPEGIFKAFACGANVMMINETPIKYRSSYALYDGKKTNYENHLENLERYIAKYDLKIEYNVQGNAPHYYRRLKDGSAG